MDPFAWLDADLRERRRLGLFRVRRRPTSAQGVRLLLDGRPVVNFSSNDYLDFASDSRLATAAARAARRFGTGAGASPLVSGLLRRCGIWKEIWPAGRAARRPWSSAAAMPPTSPFCPLSPGARMPSSATPGTMPASSTAVV